MHIFLVKDLNGETVSDYRHKVHLSLKDAKTFLLTFLKRKNFKIKDKNQQLKAANFTIVKYELVEVDRYKL